MGFTTQIFLFLFAPICFTAYYLIILSEKSKHINAVFQKLRAKDLLLIILSCGFYAWACFNNVFRLLAYILVIYIFGYSLERFKISNLYLKIGGGSCADKKAAIDRRLYLSTLFFFAAVTAVTFYLVYIKYSPMLVRIWNFAFGDHLAAHNLIAPLGLSFITFSAVSYLADIYRGDAPAGSLIDCALYILFFPKIVSGPIILWKNFQAQIKERTISLDLAVQGINRIMIGFAKKVILADSFGSRVASMGTGRVDRITAAGALLLYMLQIYYDFSGYSDIAIGLSNLFGFRFDNNFNFPYRSKSITEFWRRWHISLGAWFKEYIYIPLGGSRVNLSITLRNLFIVFLLTGIWHGCGKTYLLWGLINAVFVMLERILKNKKIYRKTPRPAKYICTMLIVMCFWQLFRFGNIADAANWFGIILGSVTFDKIYYTWRYYFDLQISCFTVIGILGATVLGSPRLSHIYHKVSETKTGYTVQELILFVLFITAILFMVNSTYHPFIYFRY